MRSKIKINFHDPEDRVLQNNIRLAWLDEYQGVRLSHCITAVPTPSALTLVLYSGQQAVATTNLPGDRIWTERRLMESPYFLGMLEQLKILAQQELEEQDASKKSDLSAGGGASGSLPKQPGSARLTKLAFGVSVAALVVSLASASVAFYALKVGLGAHVNAVANSVSVDGRPAITADVLAGLMGGGQKNAQAISAANMKLVSEAAARTGFSLNERGQMVVMFSDPLCPACRQFEHWIAKDKYQTFAPLMVPVAIQPGAREAAAAVLCSKNQGEKWAEIIAADPTATPSGVCEEGLQAVDRNSEIFRLMGLTHTPTFVAMNGRFLVGSRSPQEMRSWAEANDSAAP